MDKIHLLVSMSLSEITLFLGTAQASHTLDNSHQALSVCQLSPAFLLKEAVPGLLVTHICVELNFHSWPGCDPLPCLFIFPCFQGLGKVFDWTMFHGHSLLNTSTCSLLY